MVSSSRMTSPTWESVFTSGYEACPTLMTGTPVVLPDELLARFPELRMARVRRGGIFVRIGGWCLGIRSVAGITLGRTIWLAHDVPLDPGLLLHEIRHVQQFSALPWFPFRYVWESLRRGYRRNRYEIDAETYSQRRLHPTTVRVYSGGRRRTMKARLLCALAVVLLTTAVSAQTGLRSASLPDRTPMNPIPAVPMGLPSASLPDRTPQQPIPPPRSDVFLARPHTYVPRPFPPFYPGYGYAPYMVAPDTRDVMRHMQVQDGYLHLQMQPVTAQVHVDGMYMGTVDDFRRLIPGHPLEAGPHRIEVRAPGYTTATFDVRVRPNETISYRTDLESASGNATVTPVVAPGRPKTFYVVPGCYAGDKPPSSKQLPRGCDASKVRTIPPSVSLIARAR
jgi:PEGA domain